MTLDTLRARLATDGAPAAPTLYDRVHGLAELVAAASPDGTVEDVAAYLTGAYAILRNNPTLASCQWGTIAGAIMTGARLGLSFSPELGHAWLIPRRVSGRWSAVFQLGYRGVLELARRSGRVGTVRTGYVYDWADVDAVEGTESRLVIRRDYSAPHGDPVGYWCVVEMLDGSSPAWSLLTRAEVEAIRASIPGATDARSAWSAHFDSMAQVAAFRRLRSMLPLSVELEHALAVDGTTIDHDTPGPALEAAPAPMLAALADAPDPARPASIAEGGDIPDGEPWAPDPDDAAPSSPADAPPPTAPAGDEPLEEPEPEPEPEAAVAPPRPRMPAVRDWARRHRLTTTLDTAPRNVAGCLDALAAALDVDADTVADWVRTDTDPQEAAG
jgi:recombination protein RecT